MNVFCLCQIFSPSPLASSGESDDEVSSVGDDYESSDDDDDDDDDDYYLLYIDEIYGSVWLDLEYIPEVYWEVELRMNEKRDKDIRDILDSRLM